MYGQIAYDQPFIPSAPDSHIEPFW